MSLGILEPSTVALEMLPGYGVLISGEAGPFMLLLRFYSNEDPTVY